MTAKNIALFIYSCPFRFPPTINAANILAEKGYNVHLIGVRYDNTVSQVLDPRVKLYFIDRKRKGLQGLLFFWFSILKLIGYCYRQGIDTVISYDARAVLPAFVTSKLKKITWVLHQHDFWDKPSGVWPKFLWKCEHSLARFADHVSFPQLDRAEVFAKLANLENSPIIVHNGPRKNWLLNAYEPHESIKQLKAQFQYLLIYQGGWSVHFNLERIFDALAQCKTNTALVMLGEEREQGIKQHYENYIANLGLSDRVYLSQECVSYDSLPRYTMFADVAIAILTSEDDEAPFNNRYLIGASNKIGEYTACGLPVVTEGSAVNKRFLEQYPVGLTVNSKNSQEFARTLDELLLNQELRSHLKKHNQRLFETVLSFDQQFQKIIDIIK